MEERRADVLYGRKEPEDERYPAMEKGINARDIQNRARQERRQAQLALEQQASADMERLSGENNNGEGDDVDGENEIEEPAESSAAGARRSTRSRRAATTTKQHDEGEDEPMDDAPDSDYEEEEFEARDEKAIKASSARAAESGRKRRRSTTTITVNLSTLGVESDDDLEVAPTASSSKKKLAKSQLKKAKKAEAKKVKKARRDAGDEVSDDDDSDYGNDAGLPAVLLPGQIAFCAECNCRFTVTPYSRPGPDDEGLLCNACGKKNAPVEAAARKKKQVTRTNKKSAARALLDGDSGGVKSLQELCIELVAKHIDDVEMLGNIGTYNMDKICQIISKNRSLNDHTMKLFLEPGNRTINLYDCYKIESDNLRLIAAVIPTLRRVQLKFCGRMRDDCLDYYGAQLKELEALELYGAFNVTEECYVRFFQTIGKRLKEFGVSDTSRFQLAAMEALVDNCPDLEVLRLRTLTNIDDQCIRLLTGLPNLRVLEISEPARDLTDQPIIDILNTCGSALKELNLDGCTQLTDAVLEAIHESCGRLETLSLQEVDLLTNKGLSLLFIDWSINCGLHELNVTRCINLESSGLIRIVDHSGHSLERLSINSCKLLGKETWDFISQFELKELEELDLSMVRTVTDEVVEKFLKISPQLRVVRAWGCHKLTEAVQLREGVHLVGREADILS
ncbi:DNA repair protein rhp7 [Drechslerella dactyloides]|uniref:DNA repair protein rhp7 n=1 Tax=Drechslerella dactyloides TaxID=74499 RepID=A0AAD6J2P1_DREDA|nr:DNA repair protein rhp7 [Drechslerella dactyloides]